MYRWGMITAEERAALNELYHYNPLLFDLACKRLVTVETEGGRRIRFPAAAFKEHPLLPPYKRRGREEGREEEEREEKGGREGR